MVRSGKNTFLKLAVTIRDIFCVVLPKKDRLYSPVALGASSSFCAASAWGLQREKKREIGCRKRKPLFQFAARLHHSLSVRMSMLNALRARRDGARARLLRRHYGGRPTPRSLTSHGWKIPRLNKEFWTFSENAKYKMRLRLLISFTSNKIREGRYFLAAHFEVFSEGKKWK